MQKKCECIFTPKPRKLSQISMKICVMVNLNNTVQYGESILEFQSFQWKSGVDTIGSFLCKSKKNIYF
jgi:hypothetical protein